MDLIARVVAVFETPAGMAVLGMAVIAFAALFIYVFWDSLQMPRRDRVAEEPFETAPPQLLDPTIISRTEEDGFTASRTPYVRNAVLVGLAVLFVVLGVRVAAGFGQGELVTAGVAAERAAQPVPVRLADAAPLPAEDGDHVSLCREEGDLSNLSVRTCAAGASVRFDLLKLNVGGRHVIRPSWASEAAPVFVTSDSHAAPFVLSDEVSFAGLETNSAASYDGYLVIGVGEETSRSAREEALRRFAVGKLSGGDRAECESRERVYSVTAAFDPAASNQVYRLQNQVLEMRREARRNAKARADLTEAEERLAAAKLLVTDRPGPIVVGITADPLSSDKGADMLLAAEAFLADHAGALQIHDVSPVRAVRACTRGAAGL